ncbi:chemotaxis protein MotB [Thiohalospira halophila DSM 15071]|uniref:Chemotaxis protein MotB n=1 Tax=Thiohalospira halophila DSM 15071 TaxID=1123397 RepID=A0A1I1UIB1_9GAMM|nr:flagellar motor protein MotB [Thiohalospira halophila]SFD70467.1 chemotaxis protein MotB [Thiohalospira halophila DSM 15071]
MAENDNNVRPIVVKRPKKVEGGHHGGSWKVAYADFVTAMMALFLLLWILETTDFESKKAIADHFQNPSAVQGPGGASTSLIDMGGAMDAPRGEGGEVQERNPQEEPSPTEESEQKQSLADLMARMQEKIQQDESLREFEDQIVMEIDEDGLRVQVIDQSDRPMFTAGGDRLRYYARDILEALGRTLSRVPFKLVVSGHTDATPYSGSKEDYTNWELSSDRANAARRALLDGGLPETHIERVTGLAASELYNHRYPLDPSNRRVSVLVTPREVQSRRLEEPEGESFLDDIGSGMLDGGSADGQSGVVKRDNTPAQGDEGASQGGSGESGSRTGAESEAATRGDEEFDPEELDRRLRRALQ